MDVAVTEFDLLSMLFELLQPLEEKISGEVSVATRADNSKDEDIVVLGLAITSDVVGQTATTNVNIHVPDIRANVHGRQQLKPNIERLHELYVDVANLIDKARFEDISVYINSHHMLQEPTTGEHYVNVNVGWKIWKTEGIN